MASKLISSIHHHIQWRQVKIPSNCDGAPASLTEVAFRLLQAIERMLDARIPAYRRRAPRHQYDESGGENSDAEHDHFRDGHHGQDGG